MNNRVKSLSVIVICKNEVDRIALCLESVHGWADEIIVLDSGSSDGTVELAKQYTDQVSVTDWPGYGPQKQRALEKANCEWVLSIDSDEAVTPELKREIDQILSQSSIKETAFTMPWAVTIYGKRLDFGRSGRSPKRLFLREGAKFSSALVHEHIIPKNDKKGKLKGRLLHFTHRDFKHAIDKFSDYAWIASQQKFEKGKRSGMVSATLHAAWMFFSVYFLRLGFLDGSRGYLMAILYAQYTFNKYAGLWTLNQPKQKTLVKNKNEKEI